MQSIKWHKNFRKVVFLLVIGIFKNLNIYSQDPPPAPSYSNSIPQSPTSSAAVKSIQVPINYYTGTVQPTIPFYQYSGKNTSLSVGFNYSGGGIKVQDKGTAVGLGWNLSAGGVITRIVRGIPDDFSFGGFLNTGSVYNASNSDLEKGIVDPMNDIFQFSFNGVSGEFYLGKGNRVEDATLIQNYLFIPDTKYQLITTFNSVENVSYPCISSFKIITENGTQYIFDDCELTKQSNPDHTTIQEGDPPYYYQYYVSSWYLTKIIAPQNTGEITIEYDTYPYVDFFELPETSSRYATNNNEVRWVEQYTILDRKIKRIKKINFPDNSNVNFVYGTSIRCDDQQDVPLKQVILKREDGSTVKGIRLDQFYSTPSQFYPANTCPSGYDVDKRMFLEKLTEFSSSTDLPSYKFEYENSVFLPSKTSKDQDLYGFYNGANNSRLVYPSNRNVNFTYAKAGSLKKITSPSGGYTSFEYESNTKSSYYTGQQMSVPLEQNFTKYVSPYHFHSDQFEFYVRLSPSDLHSISDYDPSLSSKIKIEFWDASNSNLITSLVYYFDRILDGDSRLINLPNGSYSIKSFIEKGESYPADYTGPNIITAHFNLEWLNDNLESGTALTGGFRIASLKTGDGLNTANDKLTLFNYTLSNGYSSAYTPEHPVMNFLYTSVSGSNSKDFNIYSSAINNTLTFPQGSPVGYSQVEVFDGISKTVYNFTSFADLPGYGSQYYYDQANQFPFPENRKPGFYFGLPKSIAVYNAAGTLKKRTANYYNLFNSFSYTGDFNSLKVGVYKNNSSTKYFTSRYVQLPTGISQLTETTDTTFFDDGTLTANKTTYSYDYPKNVLRSVTSNYGAKKQYQKIQKKLYYPFDYSTGGVMDNIINSRYKYGYYYSPIGSETWLLQAQDEASFNDGSLIPVKLMDATMTDFKSFNNGLILPWKSYKFLSNAPASLTSTNPPFSQKVRDANIVKAVTETGLYNNSAQNLETTDLLSGVSNSQIVDDTKSLLLASAKNAAFSEIAYSGFEGLQKGNLLYNDAGVTASATALTGDKYYSLASGNITSNNSMPAGKNYIISFYGKSTCNVNGTLIRSENNQITGWTYYEYKISGGNTLTLSGSGYVDELKVYPEGANMTSYTYNLSGAVSAVSNLNSIVKYYYDSFGRLTVQRDKDNNVVKAYEYGIKQQ